MPRLGAQACFLLGRFSMGEVTANQMGRPQGPSSAEGVERGDRSEEAPTAIASAATLAAVAANEHPGCVMCGAHNPLGLGLRFETAADGAVQATFRCDSRMQSYPRMLHGGVIAALLDAAMTNALFALGIVAVTAELTVRFLEPVCLEQDAVVRATVERVAADALYYVRSEVQQRGRTVARGSGKFLVRETPSDATGRGAGT